MRTAITVGLAGNPNAGKTTLFNALTGGRQHVGNYPGVTVECKEGVRRHAGIEYRIVDLPGIYGMAASSDDEVAARSFLTDQRPDVVVDVLDASNLERNLYLTTQLAETGLPLVLALNMSDVAKRRGCLIDTAELAGRLGAPVVETVASRAEGVDELLEAVASAAARSHGLPTHPAIRVDYGGQMEAEIGALAAVLEPHADVVGSFEPRWVAARILEGDVDLRARVDRAGVGAQVEACAARLEAALGESPTVTMAARRYQYVSQIMAAAVRAAAESGRTTSDRVDAVVTHRWVGIPLLLVIMYAVFQLTFTLGSPPMNWIEVGFGWLGRVVGGWWPPGSDSPLCSLLVDGVIGGVGGVVVFLPNIVLLFLAIAILEDTGYMARVAFIMDRLMHGLGLHGKSFIPMLIGFGCSVPAIMATRTLEDRRDRLTTMLIVPLMSCGARMPIYALIIPAFFPSQWHAPMLWVVYAIGLVLAVTVAKLLRATVLKGPSVPFVMELPPYRMPTVRSVLIHMWDRGWQYLQKAGTTILGFSILLWAATSYPKLPEARRAEFASARNGIVASVADPAARDAQLAAVDNREANEELRHTVAGRLGHALAPVLKPMGFDWRIGTALIGAVAAKEVFVAQLGIVYSMGEADQESAGLRAKLRERYSPLTGFCIMLFCLISAPCVATVAVTRRESGSWKWAFLQFGGLTVLAYLVTTTVYQIGVALGGGV